ncbi:MAG TPA: cyclic pyranopterin monophosphate synthase MoaC [Parvularcula sp.]|nr:cyclic pyranopterin monophosphate synthase MoaC [Parvularcula sp.]HBS35947.1 cyclic pyranopterin monophosphate synthase MoaC [Parvularcula sp.]
MAEKEASGLTHFDDAGRARMVDVGSKPETERRATASARVRMNEAAFAAVAGRRTKKGDPCAVAELAGVMGAKRTADLVPLCHPLPLTHVAVGAEPDEQTLSVLITASVRTSGRTGVEMEAMTGAMVAALTLYDMLKAVDKGIVVERVQLERKSGGSSGDFNRAEQESHGGVDQRR